MTKIKRFCLERFVGYDKEPKIEKWKKTKKCSDDLDTLKIFFVEGYRIFDEVDGVVIETKLDRSRYK
jgi:hypothetical protein